jgi:hypothetical protein
MPTDAILESVVTDLEDTLNGMSKAEGYWLDYQKVRVDAVADLESVANLTDPDLCLLWDGTQPGDAETGNEKSTTSHRHTERFLVSVALKDIENVGRALRRVRWDVHKVLMSGTSRRRGQTAVNTFDGGVDSVEYAFEGDRAKLGVIRLLYLVRWEHVTGDMTTR